MAELLKVPDLKLQFAFPDFVLKTQQQIARDFNRSSVTLSHDFETRERNLDELIDELIPAIESVTKLGESQLLQLLYQIDIPQQSFLSIVDQSDFYAELALLIIRREAYKVYLRSKF